MAVAYTLPACVTGLCGRDVNLSLLSPSDAWVSVRAGQVLVPVTFTYAQLAFTHFFLERAGL